MYHMFAGGLTLCLVVHPALADVQSPFRQMGISASF